MQVRQSTKIIAAISASFATLVSGFMLGAALDHNPQGEFFDTTTGAWDWENVLTLVGIWWLFTGVPIFLLFYTLIKISDYVGPRES